MPLARQTRSARAAAARAAAVPPELRQGSLALAVLELVRYPNSGTAETVVAHLHLPVRPKGPKWVDADVDTRIAVLEKAITEPFSPTTAKSARQDDELRARLLDALVEALGTSALSDATKGEPLAVAGLLAGAARFAAGVEAADVALAGQGPLSESAPSARLAKHTRAAFAREAAVRASPGHQR